MREGARRGEFEVLYVHKVDRLARRLEWSLEIVHELQALDISFKAVSSHDLSTPEASYFHWSARSGSFIRII
jgi:DNA invertase Pin-like site-specific DNA recombinase